MASLQDIAKRANVSAMTVQRALRGDRHVRPELAERIVKIAHEMRYEPNLLAKGVLHRKSMTVAILVPEVDKPSISRSISGAMEILRDKDYRAILLESRRDVEREFQEIRQAAMRRVDGIVLLTTKLSVEAGHFEELKLRKIPVVIINRPGRNLPFEIFAGDHHDGAHQVVRRMIEDGHRRIAFLDTLHEPMSDNIPARIPGWERALREADIDPATQLTEQVDVRSLENARQVVRQWLTRDDRPTAIFCETSFLALAVYQAAREMDLAIGRDLSVGAAMFGGQFVYDQYFDPPLSGFNGPSRELGRRAADRLIEIMSKKNPMKAIEPGRITWLPVEHVEGQSIGEAPSR